MSSEQFGDGSPPVAQEIAAVAVRALGDQPAKFEQVIEDVLMSAMKVACSQVRYNNAVERSKALATAGESGYAGKSGDLTAAHDAEHRRQDG